MYNGIGMTTTRGSGTNGYVVKNLAEIRQKRPKHDPIPVIDEAILEKKIIEREKMESGILDHELKRKIEVECCKLQDELEVKGFGEEQIEQQVSEFRTKLLIQLESQPPAINPLKNKSGVTETHQMNELKKKQDKIMANALGIDSEYVEGMGFDRELIELKKQQRRLEYEERQLEEAKRRLQDKKSTKSSRNEKYSRGSSGSESESSNEKDRIRDAKKREPSKNSKRSIRKQRDYSTSSSPVSRSRSANRTRRYKSTRNRSREGSYNSGSESDVDSGYPSQHRN
ncbi:Serine/arginine repetitive matrix protein 2 [Smittium mucronatum]|uniref:Serine/arginine repetitive matrix protein 2 n=1 Tax=Smittium mucronatum TaxID=133383 RepID=A0A1R0GQX9_9FUNG|nr:Serine/arginine repetitive matrix protein 2 [Smittium mucronatum]OLY84567.1 Serine/arginine repetitive matrix protein 2 [Smittium mucronatum]